MKTLHQFLLPFFTLNMLCFSLASAQSQKRAKEMADKEFSLLRYRSAADLYRAADTSSLDVIAKLGQSYRLLKEDAHASHWFEKQAGFKNQPDQFYLDYAAVLSSVQNYHQAALLYRRYLENHPKDVRARNLEQNEKNLPGFYQDSLNWKISYLNINTNADEFAPAYLGKSLIFSSNRGRGWGAATVFGWTQGAFTDLYQVDDTTALGMVPPKAYFLTVREKSNTRNHTHQGVSVNDTKILGDASQVQTLKDIGLMQGAGPVHRYKGGLNTRFHDGPISVTADEQDLFYTRNQLHSSQTGAPGGTYKLELYEARAEGGHWLLTAFPYNNPEYSTGHATINAQGTVLYFVSDMPGGYGGKDIYVTTRKDRKSEWSKPSNLGPLVNTEGDEVFPFLASGNTLYFSSDGHSGLGGLDLFNVPLKNNIPEKQPVNMGYPINSSKDDFGILTRDGKSGYFSSNRYGTDDIFTFSYAPVTFTIRGRILASSKKKGIGNATLIIKRGEQSDSVYSSSDGTFNQTLLANSDYRIEIKKSGYSPKEIRLITPPQSKNIDTTFYLNEALSTLALKDMKCDQLRTLLAIHNIYYDLDRFAIRNDAWSSMTKLVSLLETYPELHVLVSSHTDTRGSAAYNNSLSQKRAEAVIAYLTKEGIAPSRITTKANGKSKPVSACRDSKSCPEAEQQLNRRTEFFMLSDGNNITVECRIKN